MQAPQLLHNLGQSLWLDNITRDLLDHGTLQRYIDTLSVTGLTSNPTIFNQAIQHSTAYDTAIHQKVKEAIVAGSDLAWTIVRPSGLFEAPAVSEYGVEIDHIGHRFTARIDLADCLLRQARDDTHVRSAIAVATLSAKPSMLKLIWQEGIRKKA